MAPQCGQRVKISYLFLEDSMTIRMTLVLNLQVFPLLNCNLTHPLLSRISARLT